MPDQTSPDAASPDVVPFDHVWATADGTTQSPLAGLIADQPDLRGQTLTPDEWRAALDKYLKSPRP